MAPRARAPRARQGEGSEDQRERAGPSSSSMPSSSRVSGVRSLSTRPISNGRVVDFGFLAREGFSIGRMLQQRGWSYMCRTEVPIYPSLVREFFQHLSVDFVNASSVVRGVRITLDRDVIGNVLRVPVGGFWDDLPEGRARRIETILGIDDGEGIDRVLAKSLSVEMRLLHHIVSRIFIPRAGSFHLVTERDLCLMYHLVSDTPFDFPELMLTVLRETVNRIRTALPYGMLLTHFFKHFGVRLRGEETTKLHHSDVYNEHSLRRMGFMKVSGSWSRGREREDEAEASTEGPSSSSHDTARHSTEQQPEEPPAPQRTSVELNQEQLQFIVREVSSAISSRSSGDSGSSTGELRMVPHISTVNETLSQIMMRLERLEHSMNVMNGRLLMSELRDPGAGSSRDSAETARMTDELRQLRAQIVAFGGRSERIEISIGLLHHLVSTISDQLAPVAFRPPSQPFQPPPQPTHPRARPPHYRPSWRGRGAGSSAQPSVLSSSDEE